MAASSFGPSRSGQGVEYTQTWPGPTARQRGKDAEDDPGAEGDRGYGEEHSEVDRHVLQHRRPQPYRGNESQKTTPDQDTRDAT